MHRVDALRIRDTREMDKNFNLSSYLLSEVNRAMLYALIFRFLALDDRVVHITHLLNSTYERALNLVHFLKLIVTLSIFFR